MQCRILVYFHVKCFGVHAGTFLQTATSKGGQNNVNICEYVETLRTMRHNQSISTEVMGAQVVLLMCH